MDDVMDPFHRAPVSEREWSSYDFSLHIEKGIDYDPYSYNQPQPSHLENWVNRSIGPSRSNSVFIDTTTLLNACELLDAPPSLPPFSGPSHGNLKRMSTRMPCVYAFQLWDLSTILTAVILFDSVYCCANKHLRDWGGADGVNKRLGELVIRELDVVSDNPKDEIAAAMEGMWYGTQAFIGRLEGDSDWNQYGSERQRYADAWSQFLNVPTHDFKLYLGDSDHSYPSYGAGLLRNILDQIDLFGSYCHKSWSEVVSECNLREEFNTRFSYLLGIPYLANSFRAPARSVRYQRAKRCPELLMSWKVVEREYRKTAANAGIDQECSTTLPVLLAALVHRIDKLADFWEAAAELRDKAKAFRKRRSELDQACLMGNAPEIAKLKMALQQESVEASKSLTSTLTSVAGIGTVLVTAFQPKLGAAALTVQLLFASGKPWIEKNVPDWLVRAYQRIAAPHRWFLMNIGDAAKHVLNARPKIEALWQSQLDDEFGVKQLQRLSLWGVM